VLGVINGLLSMKNIDNSPHIMDDGSMTQITTIAQARQALTEIEGLLEHLESSLGSALGPIRVRAEARAEPTSQPIRATQIQPPKSFNGRIIAIFRESGGAMMPKDVVSRYQALNWPLPKGDAYKRIMNTIFYLKSKGKLHRIETGYAIP
jgi:hypothetical protein